MAAIRVGISGWTYPPWRGNFYPPALPQRLELAYASRRFNSLEINGTFYSLQRPSSFEDWRAATPEGFAFAIKGGRFLTHMRKLTQPREPLANFLASGILNLREQLGPILWQFPPQMHFNEDRFKAFFDLLPHDTAELARLAHHHSPFLKGRVALEPDALRPVRHAVEFRHESFLCDRLVNLLRNHNIALVVADVAGRFPIARDVTADFVYIRLHGSRQLYTSGYSAREIDNWAERVRAWHAGGEPIEADHSLRICVRAAPKRKSGRDVYVFFDNTDVKLRAPLDARRLARVLGVGPSASVPQVLRALDVKRSSRPGSTH